MTRIANPFRYMLREAYQPAGSGAIYKAWFGKRFLIWKAKSLQQSVNSISKEIDQRLRLGLKGPDDPFTKVIPYIRQARVGIMEIEAITLTDDPAQLLIDEYNELKAGKDDPQCLNISFFPHIPKWIPQDAQDEFREFVAKVTSPAKVIAKKSVKKLRVIKANKKKPVRKSKKKAAVRKK